MTRVAALYDIHGNLPALEAVLTQIRQLRVDQVVVGGDVLPGPMPAETLACLLTLEVPVKFIRGNGEIAVLEQKAGKHPAGVPKQHWPVVEWTAQQLSSEQEGEIAVWPKTVLTDIPGLGEVLFCHATPRNESEIFTRSTSKERLLAVFREISSCVVVCGHTHMQFDLRIGETRVVNAGSVGMPFGRPGADWLLLGPSVELRHTDYDLTEAAERIRATTYPEAQQFAMHNVLQSPSESYMLELFTGAELKS